MNAPCSFYCREQKIVNKILTFSLHRNKVTQKVFEPGVRVTSQAGAI